MAKDDKTVFDPGATKPGGGTTLIDGGDISIAAENASIGRGDALLNTYTVESDAIEGGMGSVWRVHHKGWNVDLAMKRPQPKCFADENAKLRFVHECEAWINLGLHPNIVSCYYVREISGTPTIFSEWMDGGSLEDAINKGTLYEGSAAEQQERILDIAIQFARGLHYAHDAGLIHQDVKPDNLLLTKEGDAKVADFGLAQARAALTVLEGAPTMNDSNAEQGLAMDSGKTMLARSGGYTPAYCSMEQMDGKALTRRTDIYSWAVSVMEMYVGSRPWANGVVAGLGCQSYFENARVPMPEALKALLAQCLAPEPDDRPHDFAYVEVKLHEIYKAETGSDYPRPEPKAAADTADSLNNRALSFLDLRKNEEAERCWERALAFSPAHTQCVYNQSLYLWRSGNIDDHEATRRIAAVDKQLTKSISGEGIVPKRQCDFLTARDKTFVRYYAALQLVDRNDELYLIYGHYSGDVACKNVAGNTELWSAQCHKSLAHLNYSGKEGVTGFVLHPSKQWLYSYGPDGLINKINMTTGNIAATLDIATIGNTSGYEHFGVRKLVISFDAETIACINDWNDENSRLYIVRADTLAPLKSYRADDDPLLSLGFLPDGRLITCCGTRELTIWDMVQGKQKTVLTEFEIVDLQTRADDTILVCDSDGQILLLDTYGRTLKKLFKARGECRDLHLSNVGVAAACFDRVVLLDADRVGRARSFTATLAAVSAEGDYLATNDGILYSLTRGSPADYMLCEIKSFQQAVTLEKQFCFAIASGYEALEHGAIAKAQEYLAMARSLKNDDIQCLGLNDAIGALGTRVGVKAISHSHITLEHAKPIVSTAINHKKDALVCLSGENQIDLYSLKGERLLHSAGLEGDLRSVCFSSDDKTLICTGTASPILIDIDTCQGKKLRRDYLYITTTLRYGVTAGMDAGTFALYDVWDDIVLDTLRIVGRYLLRASEQGDKLSLFFTDRINGSDLFISDIIVIDLNTFVQEKRYCFAKSTDPRLRAAFSVHDLYCVDKHNRCFGGKIYKNQAAILQQDAFSACDGRLYPTDASLTAKFDKSVVAITDAALSDNGNFMITADAVGELHVYNATTQQCIMAQGAHSDGINCMALDGSRMVTGGKDGLLKLWEVVWEYEL